MRIEFESFTDLGWKLEQNRRNAYRKVDRLLKEARIPRYLPYTFRKEAVR